MRFGKIFIREEREETQLQLAADNWQLAEKRYDLPKCDHDCCPLRACPELAEGLPPAC
jgi:hypothetical protein